MDARIGTDLADDAADERAVAALVVELPALVVVGLVLVVPRADLLTPAPLRVHDGAVLESRMLDGHALGEAGAQPGVEDEHVRSTLLVDPEAGGEGRLVRRPRRRQQVRRVDGAAGDARAAGDAWAAGDSWAAGHARTAGHARVAPERVRQVHVIGPDPEALVAEPVDQVAHLAASSTGCARTRPIDRAIARRASRSAARRRHPASAPAGRPARRGPARRREGPAPPRCPSGSRTRPSSVAGGTACRHRRHRRRCACGRTLAHSHRVGRRSPTVCLRSTSS